MDPQPDSEITALLRQVGVGDPEAFDVLVARLYDRLRRLAHRRLVRERSGHTLNTTALVHEAYMQLAEIEHAGWRDRAHFLAAASRVMRHILVDYARRRNALKRGGGRERVELNEDTLRLSEECAGAVEAVHDALERLESVSPRQSRLLEQRYFGGLNLEECAEALGVSRATVARDLRLARAWLASELNPEFAPS